MYYRSVLIFINSDVGGAERMSVYISKMLIHAGIQVSYVIIKNKENAASVIGFLPPEHQVVVVETNNHFDKIRQFYLAIKKLNPDVVFSSHYSINDKLLLLKPFFRRIRFVIRSDNYYYTYSQKGKAIIQLTYRMADVMIVQTSEMKDEFIRHGVMPDIKIFALENPVDKENLDAKVADAVSPYPEDGKKHIVAVGRFAYQKGYDYLVTAFAQLFKRNQNVELYIVGANTKKWKPEYDRIITIIQHLDIENAVHCVGYQDNPYRYVKYADIFVLSSRWEGLPNVLAEALYLKTPAAAFKCIPIVERMVRNGVDGFLAEKEDVNGLTNAMENALTLGRTSPVYVGASEDDFVKLFK